MTMRYPIDTRPAPVGALALFALLLLDEFAGATVRESRVFNVPVDRVFSVSRSVPRSLGRDDRSVEKGILDEIGRSL
jgi:hypothetical protein